MIVKSISHEQRKAAAVKRAAMQRHGQEPPLRRVPTKAQAAHVVATSRYFMRPSKTGEKALGIEGHRVHRTTEYLVGDKDGSAGKERLLHVAHRNFASTDLAGQQAEMIALMSVAPGRDDAFEHLVISPGHGVVPSRRQMDVVPGRLLELLGAGDHQAFCVWHGDTRNIHGHVGVSRVDPATGRRVALGERWLLDTLGQAIAQIEHEQGWPAEANAHYRADARGVFRTATGEQVRDAGWKRVGPQRSQAEKRAQDAAHGKVRLSTGATEFERHQRLSSDERVAQAIAWPIIHNAGSWDALHRGLATEGIRYEKKGTGARIVIGERVLTATTANWAASIAKLTPKLGEFAPRTADVEVAPYVPRRLDGADQRAAHKGAKASAAAQRDAERADIARAANDAAAALTREHRRLQQLVNDTSWSGRGEDLELARKLVGIVHRDARDAVEELRRETDRAARDLYRFPGFEAWLRDGFLLDDEDKEERERRRRARFGLILGFDGRHLPPAILLPGYEVEDDELERRYSRDGRLRFIDHGNRIEMADALDRETVRDALLVAQAKWGKVQLTGDRRFRELAADIAVELGVEIANPELQTRIAQVQRQQERLRARDAQTADHLRRRAAVVTAQWPLLREQDGRVVVDKATRERFRLGVGTMLEPAFQAELRLHLDRQKQAFGRMAALARTRPDAFRNLSGRLMLPDLGDADDAARRQGWMRDPGFARLLEANVMQTEAARRQAIAAAHSAGGRATPQLPDPVPAPERASRPAATTTRGWNGITLKPEQRMRVLAAARARLAAEDWDPADFRPHNFSRSFRYIDTWLARLSHSSAAMLPAVSSSLNHR